MKKISIKQIKELINKEGVFYEEDKKRGGILLRTPNKVTYIPPIMAGAYSVNDCYRGAYDLYKIWFKLNE